MVKKKIKKSKGKIAGKMTFSQVISKYPETSSIFFKHGMSCIGCPVARSETIEQGCLAHGLDPDKIVLELNKVIKKAKARNKSGK